MPSWRRSRWASAAVVSCRSSTHRLLPAWRGGAVLDPVGVAVESANQSRGDRPWVPQPRRKELPAATGGTSQF